MSVVFVMEIACSGAQIADGTASTCAGTCGGTAIADEWCL